MPEPDISLREYIDAKLEAVRREAQAQFAATEQAIEKSEASNEKRFTSIEDLRDTLSNFVTREVAEAQFATIHTQLLDLAQLKANELLQRERIEGLRRETEALRLSSDKAISKSEESVDKRLANMNEFRGQLADQATRFLPREVYEAAVKDMQARIDSLQSRMDKIRGSDEGITALNSRNLVLLGLAISVVVIAINLYLGK